MNLHEIFRYHGSEDEYPIFYLGHTGKNSHTFGDYESTRYGAFFTDNPDVAKQYGNVKQYEIDPSNVIDLDENNNIIYDFVQYLSDIDEYRNEFLDARGIMYGDFSTWHLFEDNVGKLFIRYLKKLNIDAVSFSEYIGEELSNTIVVIDMSKIIGNQLSFDF